MPVPNFAQTPIAFAHYKPAISRIALQLFDTLNKPVEALLIAVRQQSFYYAGTVKC